MNTHTEMAGSWRRQAHGALVIVKKNALLYYLPIERMPARARWVAPISPLSYAGDLIRGGFGQQSYFPVWLSPIMLVGFTAALMWGASRFHRRWRAKGL